MKRIVSFGMIVSLLALCVYLATLREPDPTGSQRSTEAPNELPTDVRRKKPQGAIQRPQEAIQRPDMTDAKPPVYVITDATATHGCDDLCIHMRMIFVSGWQEFLERTGISDQVAQQILEIMYTAIQEAEKAYATMDVLDAGEVAIALDHKANRDVCKLLTEAQCWVWFDSVEIYDWMSRGRYGKALARMGDTDLSEP